MWFLMSRYIVIHNLCDDNLSIFNISADVLNVFEQSAIAQCSSTECSRCTVRVAAAPRIPRVCKSDNEMLCAGIVQPQSLLTNIFRNSMLSSGKACICFLNLNFAMG